MTEHENDDLVRDGDAWEQLERMAGHDPEAEALPYPPDIAARIEAWTEETGMGPVFDAIIARAEQTGEGVILKEVDGRLFVTFIPRPAEAGEWTPGA
jgi:hypothetical protein